MLIIAAGDTHHPWHSTGRVEILLDAIRKLKPNVVVLLGDIWDAYRLSRFNHLMKDAPTTVQELDLVQRFLYWVRTAARKARIIYIPGNHEERFSKQMSSKVPEVYGLEAVSVPALLKLEDMGIEWNHDRADVVFDEVKFRHGELIRKHPGMTVREYVSQHAASYAIGHCHRMGWINQRVGSSVFSGVECGCLCTYRAAYDYAYMPNWCRGFVIFRDGVPEMRRLEK